jgi:hypothetical protein
MEGPAAAPLTKVPFSAPADEAFHSFAQITDDLLEFACLVLEAPNAP